MDIEVYIFNEWNWSNEIIPIIQLWKRSIEKGTNGFYGVANQFPFRSRANKRKNIRLHGYVTCHDKERSGETSFL